MNKKILLSSLALCMLGSAAANAQTSFSLQIGDAGEAPSAPVYVAPAPVYVTPAPLPTYYDPHHRNGDWRYWQERRRWEHDHPGHNWDREHHNDHHDQHDEHWDHR